MNGQKARPDPDYAFMRADFGEMNKLRRVLYSTTIIFLLSASARAETLEGVVDRRLSGVKHWLSCHCSNGLLLRTDSQEIKPVCLPESMNSSCDEVKLTGQFREHTSDPEATSPCLKRATRIFFVDSVECSDAE
jgi:hypothetical protein